MRTAADFYILQENCSSTIYIMNIQNSELDFNGNIRITIMRKNEVAKRVQFDFVAAA